MSAVLDSVAASVLPAPMAGGPTTPALVRAACAASSFGTLAWGTCSVEAARTQVFQLAAAGCERFGVNLFHPQAPLADAELATARALAAEFAPGDTCAAPDYSFGWDAKLQLALSAGASVVWSMFGAFSPAEVTRIHSAGAEAWTTVTTVDEAQRAAAAGVDVLCIQGPAAGGHRGTWDVRAEPDPRPLPQLVRGGVPPQSPAFRCSLPVARARVPMSPRSSTCRTYGRWCAARRSCLPRRRGRVGTIAEPLPPVALTTPTRGSGTRR